MGRGALHCHRDGARLRGAPLAARLGAVLMLGGCGGCGGCGGNEGSAGSSELCAHHDEIVTTAEDFSELDASETSADELRARAIDFRDRLDERQEVVEGERLDAALSRLEESLDAARATAAKAGDNVEERMARAEASLEEVNEKWARVQALVTDRCN